MLVFNSALMDTNSSFKVQIEVYPEGIRVAIKKR